MRFIDRKVPDLLHVSLELRIDTPSEDDLYFVQKRTRLEVRGDAKDEDEQRLVRNARKFRTMRLDCEDFISMGFSAQVVVCRTEQTVVDMQTSDRDLLGAIVQDV